LQCEVKRLAHRDNAAIRSLLKRSGHSVSRAYKTEYMSTRPSVMGPVMSSLPDYRHAAELTLLSVVGAEAATLCCQRDGEPI
jgi:hypothetical protein